jgi:hypothetical protein
MPPGGKGIIGGALRFSDDQIMRALELSDSVFKRPLPNAIKNEIIKENSNYISNSIDFASLNR